MLFSTFYLGRCHSNSLLLWNITFSLPFLISHLSLLEMRDKGRDWNKSRKIDLKAMRNLSGISKKGNRVTFFFSSAMFFSSLLKSNLAERRGCFGITTLLMHVERRTWFWNHALTTYNIKDISNKDQLHTFTSRYAQWYCGYLLPGPPNASCQESRSNNILSLTCISFWKQIPKERLLKIVKWMSGYWR